MVSSLLVAFIVRDFFSSLVFCGSKNILERLCRENQKVGLYAHRFLCCPRVKGAFLCGELGAAALIFNTLDFLSGVMDRLALFAAQIKLGCLPVRRVALPCFF